MKKFGNRWRPCASCREFLSVKTPTDFYSLSINVRFVVVAYRVHANGDMAAAIIRRGSIPTRFTPL